MRYKNNSVYDPEAVVERLREFLRFSYVTGTQAAQRIGVRDTTIYSWLQGKSTPRSATAARINAFLDSLPAERASILPIGYEYREYKNWRGFRNRGVVRFVKRRKGRSGRRGEGFKEFVRAAEQPGRNGRVMIGQLLAWNGKIKREFSARR